jgi:hypothetical protein
MNDQPTTQDVINDYRVMIKADADHLAGALESGNRSEAHRFVDAIIDNEQEIEDLLA